MSTWCFLLSRIFVNPLPIQEIKITNESYHIGHKKLSLVVSVHRTSQLKELRPDMVSEVDARLRPLKLSALSKGCGYQISPPN